MSCTQSMLECRLRNPPKLSTCLFNIQHATTDIVDVAPIEMRRLNGRAANANDCGRELIDCRLATTADVVHLTFSSRSYGSKQRSLDGVIDESVIASLLSIPVNNRRASGHRCCKKFRDYSTVWIL